METAIVRVQDLRRSGATDREIRAAVRPLSSLAPGAYADVRGLTPEADHLLRAQAVVSRLSDTALSHISAVEITVRFGIEPTRGTIEGQCDHIWRFRVGKHDCSIWDMRDSGRRFRVWSTSGPAEIFCAIFGWRAVA